MYLPPAYLGEQDDDGHTLFHAALSNPSSESVAALELVAGYKRDKTKQESPRAGRTGSGPAGANTGHDRA